MTDPLFDKLVSLYPHLKQPIFDISQGLQSEPLSFHSEGHFRVFSSSQCFGIIDSCVFANTSQKHPMVQDSVSPFPVTLAGKRSHDAGPPPCARSSVQRSALALVLCLFVKAERQGTLNPIGL